MSGHYEQRIDGPLPGGRGAYAVAHWQSDEGEPCPKAQATRAEVVVYGADGEPLERLYMRLGDGPST